MSSRAPIKIVRNFSAVVRRILAKKLEIEIKTEGLIQGFGFRV